MARGIHSKGSRNTGIRYLALPLLFFPLYLPAMPPDVPPHQLVEDAWGVTEGLPQTAVQTLHQSRDGLLWVGTQDGLARFDGIEFEIFDTETEPGLVHSHIYALAEDGDGRLWIGTLQGLNLREDGEIREPESPEGGFGPVHDLAHDPARDRVWIAAENGLFHSDGAGGFESVEDDTPYFSVKVTESGHVWAGSRGQLIEKRDENLRSHELGEGYEDHEIRSFMPDEDHLWIGTSNGLYRSSREQPAEWEHGFLRDQEIDDLLMDRNDTLWIVGTSGGYRVLPGETEPESFRTTMLGENDWLRYLHQDREGNLWIGAHLTGLHRLRESPFRRYTALDGLVDGTVWAYYRNPDDQLWIGSNDEGAFRKTNDRFENAVPAEELPHSMVMGFLHDSEDRFWITTRAGVAWFDPDTLSPLDMPEGFPDSAVFSVIEDDEARIWLASRDGLYWWDGEDLHRIGEDDGLTQPRTRDIIQSADGRIWVATDTGVFVGDPDGMEQVGEGTDLPEFGVSSLFELEGEIWATLQGGIARIDETDEVRIYRDEDGLNALIGSFLAIDDGVLWSLTHEGVERTPLEQFEEFDRGERERFEPDYFGRLDEPVAAQCNGGHGQAGLFDADEGMLWCPSLEGALRLDTRAAMEAPSPPHPLIRRVRAGGETWHVEDLVADGHLTLPADARDLEFDYSGIHFRFPAGVRHRYRLAGFEQEWTEAEDRRTAFYTNLPAGSYEFELHVENERGVSSQYPASLQLKIEPWFHETLTFRVAAVLALIGLIYAGFRFSVRRLHRRRLALERVVRKRTEQLQSLNRKLAEASITDPLTGLWNRRFLDQKISHDIAQAVREYERDSDNPNRDIAFVMLDVDHFKQINDRYGHRVGDEILSQFGRVLASLVRDADYVIRWGGEEFLVVARNSERDQVPEFMNRLTEAIRNTVFRVEDDLCLECTCSMGVAVFPFSPQAPDALDWEDMVEIADTANYRVKEAGRDGWCRIAAGPDFQPEGFMRRFREEPEAVLAAGEIVVDFDRPRG